jgi:hypothetical protein
MHAGPPMGGGGGGGGGANCPRPPALGALVIFGEAPVIVLAKYLFLGQSSEIWHVKMWGKCPDSNENVLVRKLFRKSCHRGRTG